jgi:hypothetical protein
VRVGAPIWCRAWYLWKHRKNGYTEFMRLVSALPFPQRVVHANLITINKKAEVRRGVVKGPLSSSLTDAKLGRMRWPKNQVRTQ